MVKRRIPKTDPTMIPYPRHLLTTIFAHSPVINKEHV